MENYPFTLESETSEKEKELSKIDKELSQLDSELSIIDRKLFILNSELPRPKHYLSTSNNKHLPYLIISVGFINDH